MILRVTNLSLVLLVGIQLASGITNRSMAENKSAGDGQVNTTVEHCSDLLKSENTIAGLDAKFEVHSLRELLTSDPTKNLASKYPAIVMSAVQKYYAVLESPRYPERKIKDPTYPVRKLQLIPIFSDAVPEAGKKLIVGQYEAAKELKSYFRELASGRDAGKGLLFIGPPGTGKTELLYIMDRALDNMSVTDPNFYEYTYRWKNLHLIPDLEPLVANRETGSLFIKPLQRSPITLLPAQLQKRILEVATARVQEMIGFNPAPMLQPDPQAKEILEHIVRYYQAKEGLTSVTEEKYISWLENHIDIVRRLPDETQASGIIDYQGKHPTDGQLFVSENVMLSQIYTKNSALSYDYNGQISRRDGRGVFIDELYRNEEGFLNKLLNFIQNGVVQSAGAPPLVMDTVVLAATNDENFNEARKRPGAGAAIDRLSKALMRQTINPTLVSETALHMVSKGNTDKIFKMRAYDSDVLGAADISTLFPPPDANGDLLAPEGRYAVYYAQGRGKDILIAPHALEMIGLTVAGTRLVRDPSQVPQQVTKELNDTNVTNSHFFTSVKARLEVIIKKVRPESPVYMDLDKLNKLMREGDKGISARDAERWLSKSIEIAVAKGVPVTPIVVSEAFGEMMDKNLFMDVKDQRREDWIGILTTVKADFLLPDMTNDVVEIVAGDSGAVSALYEEIKGEALALSSDSGSEYWYNESSEKRIINKDRFAEIQRVYREINNEEFVPGKLVTYEAHEARKPSKKPYAPLMRTIQKYLLKSSLNTTAMGRLVDYFDGAQVDHHTQEVARHVEIALSRRGYDRESFKQALRFVYDVEYNLRKRESPR